MRMRARQFVPFLILAVLAVQACQPRPTPEPPPLLLQVPKSYWAEAEGTITLDELTVPGRVRMNYFVYPDRKVVVPHLMTWMDDLDLVVGFAFWEVEREPLRCTVFRNDGAIHGTLEGSELVIPAGAKVLGQSYLRRGADRRCHGKARRLDTATTGEVRVVHEPEADRFAVSASFETDHQGNPVTLSLSAEGRFLNRPPVADFEVAGENLAVAADGCPVTDKGKPPIAIANTPEGLLVSLRSSSYDPDGQWAPELEPKRPRVDLSFEQWARSRPGGFSYMGSGQEVGPVLFETGREHQLLLWATDRKGAEGRKLCHFQVVPPS